MREPIVPRKAPSEPQHWLARPETVKPLKIAGLVAVVAVVAADFVVKRKPAFGIEALLGFNAWFSLAACLTLILAAKVLGVLLRREDGYYDE